MGQRWPIVGRRQPASDLLAPDGSAAQCTGSLGTLFCAALREHLIRFFLTLCLTSGLTLRNANLTICRHLICYRQHFLTQGHFTSPAGGNTIKTHLWAFILKSFQRKNRPENTTTDFYTCFGFCNPERKGKKEKPSSLGQLKGGYKTKGVREPTCTPGSSC